MPSWSRMIKFIRQDNSISLVRALQYEQLQFAATNGKLLDVGGGNKSHYRDLLLCDVYDSVNINPEMDPTWLLEPDGVFPIPTGSYDCILSMNTFEHVFKPEKLMEEATRALRPGGQFIAATPFLFRIHGSPDDFFRPTASWWFSTLHGNGYHDIRITPLVWGPFSTGAICSGLPGGMKRVRTVFNDVGYCIRITKIQTSD